MTMAKQLQLPDLPADMEWVVHADSDRFTVNLSYKRSYRAEDDDTSSDDTRRDGYVMSHTHRHPAVIEREEWEAEVVSAANHLWTHYSEGIHHANWADELMRRNR